MFAPISGVKAGFLRNRQKEQCLLLNDEECRAEVVRPGIEGTGDFKNLLVSDGPDLSTPCSGISSSGHAVKCGEPCTTGGSDAIKKAGYDERISLRDQSGCKGINMRGLDAARMHRAHPLASGVLEGSGQHVVTALGQTTLDSHVTTGPSRSTSLLFCSLTIPLVSRSWEKTRLCSVAREAQPSGRAYQQDLQRRWLDFTHCPDDPFLRETGNQKAPSVSVYSSHHPFLLRHDFVALLTRTASPSSKY